MTTLTQQISEAFARRNELVDQLRSATMARHDTPIGYNVQRRNAISLEHDVTAQLDAAEDQLSALRSQYLATQVYNA